MDQAGAGTKDAPCASSLKLREMTCRFSLEPTSYDPEFELENDFLTAAHVDDVNMSGTKAQINICTNELEKVIAKCRLNRDSPQTAERSTHN